MICGNPRGAPVTGCGETSSPADSATSATKAVTDNTLVIAAVNRCATQTQKQEQEQNQMQKT
jgi:hypothetical protein